MNSPTRVAPNAIPFGCASDYLTTHGVTAAEDYTRQRGSDAANLRAEMTFAFITPDVLECCIYGHKLRVETARGALRLEIGMVLFMPNNSRSVVCSMEQALAYILAINW